MTTEQPVIGQECGAEPRPEDGNVKGAPGVWCIHDEETRQMVAAWLPQGAGAWEICSPSREGWLPSDRYFVPPREWRFSDVVLGDAWRYTPPPPPQPLRKVAEEMREGLDSAHVLGNDFVKYGVGALRRWADAIEAAIEEVERD